MDEAGSYHAKRWDESDSLTMDKIEFFKHNIEEEDINRVVAVLHSTFLTNATITKEFEMQFAKYLGVKYAVGVNSCTAALHLSLLALDIGVGDEVITTPMSFVATANAVLHAGATPVFVDVEGETGNIDASLIEAAITSKTKAILPVHLYGTMCDMHAIRKIADQYGLKIIEDCAHSIEGERDGVRPGALSDAACFSFYATKNITSGEGGAIACNDAVLAEKLYKLRLHGINKDAASRYYGSYKHWDMDLLGWKYNISDIQSALLIGQLDRITDNLKKREQIAKKYEMSFVDIKEITLLKIPKGSISARHLFTILVENRDALLIKLQQAKIGVAVNYRPIHSMKYYQQNYHYEDGNFPHAERIGNKTISIPLYPSLTMLEVDYIISTIKEIVVH